MFDIAKLDTLTRAEQGAAVTLRNPLSQAPILDEAGKPVTITVLGRQSEKARGLERAIRQRNTAATARGITLTDDDFRAQRNEYLAAVTTGWTFDSMDGQPFPCTPENAAKLYADPRLDWIARAVYGFSLEEGNFLAL